MQLIKRFLEHSERSEGEIIRIEKDDFDDPYAAPQEYELIADIDILQILIPAGRCAEVVYRKNGIFEVTRHEQSKSDGRWKVSRTPNVPIVNGKLRLGISGELYDIETYRNGTNESVQFGYTPPGPSKPLYVFKSW